jgi:ATP-dependent Clp protease ATP-binding subunit ClpC
VTDAYDRLTPRGKRVLQRAASEADRYGHGYTGTEHLLLALLAGPHGIAGRVLRDLGVEKAARARINEILESPGYNR